MMGMPDGFNIGESASIIRDTTVFVSHDARDWQIAGLFCTLIERASLEQIKTFCSSRDGDINCGHEWYDRIKNEIGASSAIVCLLTKHSVKKPWILFEAGIAKGAFPNRGVRGVKINVRVRQDNPFHNFQLYNCEEKKILSLIKELIKELTDIPSENEDVTIAIGRHSKAFFKKLEKLNSDITQ